MRDIYVTPSPKSPGYEPVQVIIQELRKDSKAYTTKSINLSFYRQREYTSAGKAMPVKRQGKQYRKRECFANKSST